MFASISGVRAIAVATAAILLGSGALAQNIKVTVAPGPVLTVRAGQVGEVRLIMAMDTPWYVYAPTGRNAQQGLVETKITVASNPQIQFAAPAYPKAQPYGGNDVWRGRGTLIRQPFRVRPRTAAGRYQVKGYVDFQTCNGDTCLPPERKWFSVPVNVSSS